MTPSMKSFLFIILALVVISFSLAGCASSGLMPGDESTGCTRMVSKAKAGGASGVFSGDGKYCKYIEKGDCPTLESMTFEQLREMCRDM